jgi:hypothetical protein
MPLEPLNTQNIIEIKKIQKILRGHPDLENTFMLLIRIANKEINKVKDVKFVIDDDPIEDDPILFDHSSDEDDLFED